jgi:hypothetical protein
MAQLDRCVLMDLTHYPIHQASIHASGSGFSLHAEPALRCARECSADWRVRQERGALPPNRSLCGARDATSRASAEKKKTERVRHKLSANRVVRPELPDLRCCSSRSWTSDLHTQFGVKSSSLDFA